MSCNNGRGAIIMYEPTTSTWGTAVAPGATDLILAESFGPLIDPADIIPDPSAGYAWHEYIDRGKKNVTPELVIPMRFSGRLWTLVAQLMGLDTISGASDPYTHTMTLLDCIGGSDKFGTAGAEIGGSLIHEWPSVKPVGFTISGPDGNGYMSLVVRTICDTVNLGSDATIVAGDFDAATHIALSTVLPPIIPFGVTQFKINDQSGAAVTAETAIDIKSIEFTFNRGFSGEFVSRGVVANQWESAEPKEDGIPEQTLKIELADYDSLTYFENYQDKTTKKAQLYWQLTSNHNLTLELPALHPVVPEGAISGPSRMPQVLNYQCKKALENPTGMAFALWQIVLKDGHDTAYE